MAILPKQKLTVFMMCVDIYFLKCCQILFSAGSYISKMDQDKSLGRFTTAFHRTPIYSQQPGAAIGATMYQRAGAKSSNSNNPPTVRSLISLFVVSLWLTNQVIINYNQIKFNMNSTCSDSILYGVMEIKWC